MIIGIPTETYPEERRVALTPEAVAALIGENAEILLQAGAGTAAGFPDPEYKGRGAQLVERADLLGMPLGAPGTGRCAPWGPIRRPVRPTSS